MAPQDGEVEEEAYDEELEVIKSGTVKVEDELGKLSCVGCGGSGGKYSRYLLAYLVHSWFAYFQIGPGQG